MKVTAEQFKDFARDLNMNSVVGDELTIESCRPYAVRLHKNSDHSLAELSILPADYVELDMQFSRWNEARIWCVNNIRGCYVNADFCEGL